MGHSPSDDDRGDGPDPEELATRVAALEAQVRELRTAVETLRATAMSSAAGRSVPAASPATAGRPATALLPPTSPGAVAPAAPVRAAEKREGIRIEHWIDRLGIALLLLGVGFLLKYTYDQGLLVPHVRVVLGLGVAAVLLAAGFWVRRRNRRLAAILMGGSIALLYGTLFASYQLFELLTYPAAFGAMAGVTVAAFALATAQKHALVAVIGAIGGFATPFLLYAGLSSVGSLGVYVALVLAGTTAVYLVRGWPSLLLTSMVGGWLALGFGVFEVGRSAPASALGIALTHVGLLAGVAATGWAPAARAWRAARAGRSEEGDGLVLGTTAVAPLVAVVLSHELLTPPPWLWLAVLAGLGLAYGAVGRLARGSGAAEVGRALVAAGVGLCALGVTLAFEGPVIHLAVASGAVGLSVVAARGARADLRAAADLALMGLTAWAVWLLLLTRSEAPPFLSDGGVQLLVTSAALWLAGRTRGQAASRSLSYQLANGLLLVTVWHELRDVEGTELITTALWGADALVLLALGFARRSRSAQLAGLVAVLAASLKLVIFDMDTADTMWRVGIFMAIGTALLVMSYVVPRWQEEGRGEE